MIPSETSRSADIHTDSISEPVGDWIRQFVKHFEINFVDASRRLPADAELPAYQHATVQAVFETLLDSGMTVDEVIEMVGQAAIERPSGPVQWNAELNQRRFALIDKEIQGTLTPAETVELAGLTRIMREQIDTEAYVPLEGAKALHRKLLQLDGTDKPR